jgi:Zn-dependent protease with chaperone function
MLTRSIIVLALVVLLSACQAAQTALPAAEPTAVAAETERQRARAGEAGAGVVPSSASGTAGTALSALSAGLPDNAGKVAAVESMRRLFAVGDAVMIHGAPLCAGKLAPRIGMRPWNSDDLAASMAQQAGASGAGYIPTLFALARNGPADRAGMREGDQIVSLNGWHVPDAPGAARTYDDKIRQALAAGGTIAVGYRRAGREAIVHITPTQGCDYTLVFHGSQAVNARSDGRRVIVARGLVDLLQDDAQLALFVGHELAHNVRNHHAAKLLNATAGAAAGLALDVAAAVFGASPGERFSRPGATGRADAFSQDLEREADYVGLYFAALAGFDANRAAKAWRRMAAANPRAIDDGGTHPTTAERFVALEAAAREISTKIAQGQPLRPNTQK